MTAPTVERWRARPGEALQSLTFRGHEDDVVAVDVSPDGRWVVSGSTDGSLRLWSVDEVREEKRWVGAHGVKPVYAARFSPDGALIASGGGDGVARLWDAATRAELASFPSATGSAVFAVDVAHAEGARPAALALGDEAGRVALCPLGGDRRLVGDKASGAVHAVALRRAGDGALEVLAGTEGGWGRLWGSAWPQGEARLLSHRPCVSSVAFAADGTCFTAGYDGRVLRWERAPGGAPGGALPPPVPFQASQGELNGLAVSQDGSLLATAGDDRRVRVWERGGRPVRELPRHPDLVYAVALSRGGAVLATACKDRVVRAWLLRPPAPQPGPAPAPSFSFGLAARQAAPSAPAAGSSSSRPPPAAAPPGAPGREAAPPEREAPPPERQGGRFLGPPSPGRGDGREPPPLGLLELELGPPRSPSPMSPSYSPTSPGYIPRSPSYAPEPDSPVYAPASPPHLPGSFSPVPESLRRKRKRAPPAAPEADPDAGASSSAHPPQGAPAAGGEGAGSSSSRAARRAGAAARLRAAARELEAAAGEAEEEAGAARGRAERAEAEAAALRAELEAARGEAQRLRAELEAARAELAGSIGVGEERLRALSAGELGALEERLDGARRRASALRYEAGVREAAAAAAEVATTCVVCLARPREVKVQPCDHASMCEECCERVWSGDRRCPLCRGEITMRSRIRL